ncbi:predicted protein [Naegleria gruberi]|uniref:Predicted protein n=1 Tax=Naegleria gruberi TaxID=5762 RepID=D2UZ15_NAEGR|nr:uncharacterized protein NAEGRDRAFT_61777 [Naegleria gruberi]EFC50072.1 predicted protein [Naegleria gruberi]|eukprot:XP_002682816.1 predicted protein [Naegleria gruberi strain NEG-M]
MFSSSTLIFDTSKKGILSLYRTVLKEGNKFPKEIQRTFVKQKASTMFRKDVPPQELEDAFRLALTHIDNIRAQVETHRKLYADDRLSPEDLERIRKEELERESQRYRDEEKQGWDN